MKLGIPSHPRRDPLQEIDWAAAHGFDFVDLCLEPDRAAAEAVDPAAIRARLAVRRLGSVGHLAWYLPIGSPMPQLRRAAVGAATDYFSVFAAAGVAAVTVHSHWPPASIFTAAEGIGWQVESLRALLDEARRRSLTLLYEPVGAEFDTMENTGAVADALPELRVHLDLGHCNLHGRSPRAFIRRFAPRLGHIHLHDNNGQGDLHLPPGTGSVNWRDALAALREAGYDGTITLEVFSPDRDYVLLARDKVRAEWDAPGAVPARRGT